MHLPDVDGIELLQQTAPDMVIIAVTRTASLDTAIAAVKFSIYCDYLVKTEDINQVCNAISNALHQRANKFERRSPAARSRGNDGTVAPHGIRPTASGPEEQAEDVIHISPVQLNLRERTLSYTRIPTLFVD